MKLLFSVILIFLAPLSLEANQENLDSRKFAENYFAVWKATQLPQASSKDLERYLDLLADDVGHQHLPYDPDSDRDPEGKNKMREGMTYYMGVHTEYDSKLTKVISGFNVVIIKYYTHVKGKHPQTGEIIEQSYDTVEVLELENGKVSVIRKYSE